MLIRKTKKFKLISPAKKPPKFSRSVKYTLTSPKANLLKKYVILFWREQLPRNRIP